MHVYGAAIVHGPQSISAPHNSRQLAAYQPPLTTFPSDEVQISSMGELLARVHDLPDIRTDRVAALRSAIASGNYDSEERLSLALDRLLDEVA